MSLYDLLYRNATITGFLQIVNFNIIEDDEVVNTDLFTPIPFALADLPDIILAGSAASALLGNTLTGNSTSSVQLFVLPPISKVINIPSEFDGNITINIPGSDPAIGAISFDLVNSPKDFLVGFGGADDINGFSGDDVLIGDGLKSNEGGTDGSDSLSGGTGNDVLIGGGSGDVLRGDEGDDFILGDFFLGLTNAVISININRRIAQGSDSFSFLGSGGSYNYSANIVYTDSIELGSGNEGNDSIFGGSGNDTIIADSGNDTVNGDSGNDIILGFAGVDILNGGLDNDIIFGDSLAPNFAGIDGADTLNGNEGSDFLVGGGLGDTLNGGDGDDVLLGDYFLGLFSGSIRLDTPETIIKIPSNIPPIVFGVPGELAVTDISIQLFKNSTFLTIGSGNEGADSLNGGAGNDIAIGDKGSDILNLDSGNDTGIGGAGVDFINGGSGNDILLGDLLAPNFLGGIDGGDTINGDGGDDFVLGGGGNDLIAGGDGNDILFGDYLLGIVSGSIQIPVGPLPAGFSVAPSGPVPNTIYLTIGGNGSIGGNDTVLGGNGDDVIFGDSGNDSLFGDSGLDVLVAGGGDDAVSGGIGNDIIFGDFLSPNFQGAADGADVLNGDLGSDFILAGGGGDSITGGDGDDVLLGDYLLGLFDVSIPLNLGELPAGLNVISIFPIGSGNEGNDTIRGGIGDDVIIGDKGSDYLDGGDNNDFVLGGANSDSIYGGLGDDTLIGDLLAPNAYGSDGVDTIDGGGGEDVIIGGGLGDLIYGGEGNDFILGDYFFGLSINSPISIPLSRPSSNALLNDALFLDSGTLFSNDVLTLPDIELLIGSGNEGNDTIYAGAGDDVAFADKGQDLVYGEDGSDTLLGGADNDTLVGGAGDDIIAGDYILPPGSKIKLDPDTLRSVGSFLLLTEAGELIINGGPEGDDLLEGNAGNDILIGDGGTDTATYANDPGPVIISLGNIFNPGFGYGFDGYGNFDTLISIENLIGSDFDDTLNGDDKANIIWGGTGNDTISGLAGNDTLYGEAGDDSISAGDGDDYIVGGTGADYIDGGNGIDTTSYLESDFGVVVDIGVVDVNLFGISLYTQGYGYSGDARGDTLINIENIEGSQFVDQLWGTNGANKIEAFDGDDQIFGRGGDDFLEGANGNDIIRAGEGNDNVYGGGGRDNLFGDAGDDFVYGGAGFDELTGGDGNDRIFGEDGTDRLFGGNGDDQLSGGNDNDSIYGNVGVDYLDGGAGSDLLSGDEGNDILKGGEGNDSLKGGIGNDWIEGGLGSDNLYGGTGKDLFVFSKDPITGERGNGSIGGITDGSSNTIFFGETNGIPYLAPGTIDTIYDFKNSGQWWEFGANIDQIGLRDGLRYQDLIFVGVSTVPGGSTASSTLIGYSGRNESFAPIVEVIGLTPDKFKSADFVIV